jgi:hypothetical protein
VVVLDDLGQRLGVAGVAANRRSQASHGGAGRGRGLPAHLAFTQQLDGVAEAHALGAHDPVDRRPASLAGPQAVPKVLPRAHDKRGLPVVVERAAAHQVRPGLSQLDPRSRDEGTQGDLCLQPLDLLVSNAGHRPPLQETLTCRTC